MYIKKIKFMVSILIATKNRPKKLSDCIKSILKNNFKNFEIIIIDQTKDIFDSNLLLNKKIRYYHHPGSGKSIALNFAITQTQGNIVSFTDDDCIVHKNWLKKIDFIFKKNLQISGIFGKSLPYQPEKHKNLINPPVFTKENYEIFSNPATIHYKEIGLGNNMAFRKSALEKVGLFKTWLGKGSVCQAGGIESELIYRLFSKGYKLAYEPNIIIWHNRWITESENLKQQVKYTIGIMAFVTYSSIHDHNLKLKNYFTDRFKDRIILPWKYSFDQFRHLNYSKHIFKSFIYIFIELFSIVRGFIIGFYFSSIDRK